MASTTQSSQAHTADQPPTQSSETDQPRISTVGHPQPGYPQSTMNYAQPQNGYPPPPPYHGYPPTAGYNPYQADPNAYYATTYSQHDEAASSFARCFCIILFLLLTGTLLASIIMFAVVRPENVTFKVESFGVSNFNMVPTTKVVSGKWEATMFVENPSFGLRMHVDKWETALYHKDNFLSSGGSFMQDMRLDSKSKGTMQLKMEMSNSTAGSSSVEDMEKEQKEGGGVSFSLRMSLTYTMQHGWWYSINYRAGILRVKCTDLKVNLPVGASSGSMPGGSSKKCDITDGW
ncbi:hypothetical protein DVH24_019276 [Malus domestica]|uniref:Late embryogenesis abundant protein LEA-2 subgroup domain-containing protein n=1 Tax=Malus domestica TaxID=3750 RepID=A0A498HXN1_MALDO|nr:hypothetical protein DVH24_019276 [Malus domestica]